MKIFTIIKIIISLALAFLITFLLYAYFFNKPIEVYFNDDQGLIESGEIYIDSNLEGEISKMGFFSLARKFCNNSHTIKLSIEGTEHEFAFYPADCKYDKLNYNIFQDTVKIEKTEAQIQFVFLIKETQAPLNGILYFDNIVFSDVYGSVEISRDKCRSIKKITLDHGGSNITWTNGPDLCLSKDILNFPVNQKDLEEGIVPTTE
jgi:hypothetical protein